MLREAFEKAGLPTASVAFASACHDLARLALNRESDPKRAMHVWLGMAAGLQFRGPLEEFLIAVARERVSGKTNPIDVRGHNIADAHPGCAPASIGTLSGDDSGHMLPDDQSGGAASSPELVGGGDDQNRNDDQSSSVISPASKRERGDHATRDSQSKPVAPLAPRSPSPEQMRAVTAAKAVGAAVLSGVYIPDHRGGREPFDDIKIRYYKITLDRLARTVGRASVAYNLVRIAETKLPANYQQLPLSASSRDVFPVDDMREMQKQAAVFAGHGLISLPEELRSAVVEAVSLAHGES